ncbi:MAG TPA: translesion DNA synthesis-associated protein ImuA [Candidatus Elarobacter sp.]
MNLEQVLQRPDVWRGSHAPATQVIASGFPALDPLLPGGGWPHGAITEIALPHDGIGELRLLLPALARLSRSDSWIAFIAPLYIPYAPALAAAGVELSRVLLVHPHTPADHRWAIESSLRAGACAAALAWIGDVDAAHVRRWQLAAEAGGTCGILFQRQPISGSSAALRLQLASAGTDALTIHVLKRRGGWPIGPVRVELDHALVMRASAPPFARDLSPRRAR